MNSSLLEKFKLNFYSYYPKIEKLYNIDFVYCGQSKGNPKFKIVCEILPLGLFKVISNHAKLYQIDIVGNE